MAADMSDIEMGEVDESALVLVKHGGGTDHEEWTSTFKAKLRWDSPLPASCCIFRVPEVLRIQKREAYEPHMVSIGPFHRGRREQYQLVENVKEWYLECLLRRLNIGLDSLIEYFKGKEERARACYSEPFIHDLDQKKFVEMLILDGCFLIELFRKAHVDELQDENDPIFNLSCLLEYLYHDLMLIENQLPWFVLEYFYNLIESGNPDKALSEVVIDFFKQSVADARIFSYPGPCNTLHILDLIRTALVQEHQDSVPVGMRSSRHLPRRIPSAITLSEVSGVKFKKGGPFQDCILDIEFNRDGVFIIPKLVIDSSLGPLFRNLIAYEQLYHRCSHHITSYAVLMDSLLGSIKDVDLLSKEGILVNMLSAEDASQFFNELYNYDSRLKFHYAKLLFDVNRYCLMEKFTYIPKSQRNKWIRQLKQDYFDTPWKILSWFVAGTLLVLTLLQTIYTLKQYYHHPSASAPNSN